MEMVMIGLKEYQASKLKKQPQCFNCQEIGHMKGNCPKPNKRIEWTKVHCSKCKEMGHTPVRCMLRLFNSTCFKPLRVLQDKSGKTLIGFVNNGSFPGAADPETGEITTPSGCSTWMFYVEGNMIDVFERQYPIMQFLVSFRDLVLEEANLLKQPSSNRSIEKVQPPLPSNEPEKTCIKD